jgi:ribose transport system permease protein
MIGVAASRARMLPRGLVFLAVMVVFFLLGPQLAGQGSITNTNYSNISSYVGAVGPIALAVGIGMVLGEFDLSVVSSYALGSVLAVKIGGSPWVGLAVAAAAGAAAGLIQGFIVGRLNISSVPVTLAGFLVLWGIAFAWSGGAQLVFDDYATTDSLNQTVFGVLTINGIAVGGVFLLVALLFAFTRVGATVRAVGGERRASKVAGVPVTRTLALTFAAGGAVAAAGGALQAFTTSAAIPDVTFDPLINAVIAAVIGGVAITGGEGSPLGILSGVLSIAFLEEAFVVMGSDSNLVAIVTGSFLLLVATISAPELGRTADLLRTKRAGFGPGRSRRAAARA